MNNITIPIAVLSMLISVGNMCYHLGINSVTHVCDSQGGIAQAQGIGNGPIQQLGYECREGGEGGKITIR